MSWLLFMDESGHDHKTMPYEVRGGFALHACKVWPFILALRTLEQSTFGAYLHEYGTEIKGCKLLTKDRFKWAAQGSKIEAAARRKHALNFLNSSTQGRAPRRDEFTAFGQACLDFAEGVILLLQSHGAKVFASIIPRVSKPPGTSADYLRRDHVYLFERFFHLLEQQRDQGLLVMDETDHASDRDFVRRMERYFTSTLTGRQRTQWIVPVPLFVTSEMAYGVQVADLCLYCINCGLRLPGMTKPTRPEIESFAWLVERIVWRGEGYRDGKVFKTQGICFVPDPYGGR